MPFDGKDFPLIAVPTVKPFDFDTATGDERLLELAKHLEDDQVWRNRLMVWDFSTVRASVSGECGTAGCAAGLASALWGRRKVFGRELVIDNPKFLRVFGITEDESNSLFGWELSRKRQIPMMDVTPGMVATAIKEFVANRQAAS